MFTGDAYKVDWEMCTIYLSRKMTSTELIKLISSLSDDAKKEDNCWTIIVVSAQN